jgi:hypothetical protein
VQPRRSYSRLHAIIADSASFANSADRFANNFASDRSALAELQPRISLAHQWYNENGDQRSRGHYPSWEAYWGVLSNRAYYFFHRHAQGFDRIRIYAEVAEWPGTVSEDGLTLIPPALPEHDELHADAREG